VLAAVALFIRFLAPILDRESKDFVAGFSRLVRQVPQMYDKLEDGIGGLLTNLDSGGENGGIQDTDDKHSSRSAWGFGPPVHLMPSPQNPHVPHLPELTLGSRDSEFSQVGLGPVEAVPPHFLASGLGADEQARPSALVIRPAADGTIGVELGDAPVEVRQTGDGRYVLTSRPLDEGAARWGDIKTQVITAMRQGLQQLTGNLLSVFFLFFQGLVSGLMGGIVAVIVVFIVAGFAMIDAPAITAGIRNRVPGRFKEHYDDFLRRLTVGLAGALRGQLLICLVNGVLSTIGFLIFIPPYAVIMGIVAAVFTIVPVFGTIMASIPVILIALTMGPGNALGVAAWILVIHFIETYFLDPRIIGRQARMHPILVIFVLIAGEQMYGVKGLLLAVPAASILQTILQFAYSRVHSTLAPDASPSG
jgi:predicted PurR-regulated permease PerM